MMMRVALVVDGPFAIRGIVDRSEGRILVKSSSDGCYFIGCQKKV